MNSKIQVSFTLTGVGFDPNTVSSVIGINPTKTWRFGEQIQNTLLKTKHDGWSISTGKQISIDLNVQLHEILKVIKTHIPQIKKVIKDYKLNAEFACAIYIDGDNIPVLNFEKDVIKIICELDAAIDIDVYLV